MRCDLHVHTTHSGMCTVPVFSRVCRESYNDPLAVYETLRGRGMDLVTVTDHDSIDAAEPLRRYPDFFLSEEVTCWTPSGTELHMGVYGIEERQHTEIQRRRKDLLSLVAYLEEQRLFFSINHLFSRLTGRRTDQDFSLFASRFPAYETLNGQMLGFANRSAASLAASLGKAAVGGSDAHAMFSLGLTYTEVPGARNSLEFLQGLKQARGRVHGECGSMWKLTRMVWQVALGMLHDNPWTVLLTPAFVAVPAITLPNCLLESLFARKWAIRLGITPMLPVAVRPGTLEVVP